MLLDNKSGVASIEDVSSEDNLGSMLEYWSIRAMKIGFVRDLNLDLPFRLNNE